MPDACMRTPASKECVEKEGGEDGERYWGEGGEGELMSTAIALRARDCRRPKVKIVLVLRVVARASWV